MTSERLHPRWFIKLSGTFPPGAPALARSHSELSTRQVLSRNDRNEVTTRRATTTRERSGVVVKTALTAKAQVGADGSSWPCWSLSTGWAGWALRPDRPLSTSQSCWACRSRDSYWSLKTARTQMERGAEVAAPETSDGGKDNRDHVTDESVSGKHWVVAS